MNSVTIIKLEIEDMPEEMKNIFLNTIDLMMETGGLTFTSDVKIIFPETISWKHTSTAIWDQKGRMDMDRLELNISDIEDREDFLKHLQGWLRLNGVVANGIFRMDVDPETGEDKGTVQIINNAPALPGREVKNGHNNVGELYGINFGEPLKSWQNGDNNTSHYRDFRTGGSSDGSRLKA